MNGKGRDRAGQQHEDENQQPVIGAAAFRDRHDRKPLHAGLMRHADADQALVTGASASMKKPGTMPATRQSAARKYIAASELLSVSFAFAAAGVRATAEETHAERLDEAGGGERRRQCQQRADRGHQEFQSP